MNMHTLTAPERRQALAIFAEHTYPEGSDAVWGCAKDHEHRTRAAAEKCGGATLAQLSDALARHLRDAATFVPRIGIVVKGPPGVKVGTVVPW
jgi:hypothetical protein